MKNKFLAFLLFILAIFVALPALCQTNITFSDWLLELRNEALDSGISQQILDASLTNISPIARIIELDRRQPEFTLTFQEYLDRVVNHRRINQGKINLSKNIELLNTVSKRFNVQPRFLVALWGIETNYGRNTGGFPVVASLATLAYDGRRSKYFRKELFNALRILDDGHIEPSEMMGSWAGAMGQSQFMPSSFINYAYDFNHDGKKDIWNDKADIFASAANYLSRSGWRSDITWGREVKIPNSINKDMFGLKVIKTMDEWQALGVRKIDGSNLPSRNIKASVVFPGKNGNRCFLVYNNFRALLRWNRSNYFATAVGILSDMIANK
ncbi:MAG: lytic transglycosylase [Alphaproteobacteria bacterium]|nr:lytic transglycosylase [Alphaproteobacteria bacterium]PPR12719.1 MAG: Membrane-bound lytic murein transglycosylase B [Alphaproteobacteria bacterium MarineAlpha12_Bin1]